ncbi:MAG: serine hydrolase [Caloramator sp.]|nr:serine hydrolase [Caloramator sp.]
MFKKRTIIFIFLVILIFDLFNMVKAKSNEKITLNAKAVYVATTDGKILYEFNSNAQLPIASLTKIMTYLVSRELMHKHSISVNKTIYPKFPKMPYDADIMGLNPKHKVKIGDLLNYMMSISANDAAEALKNYFTYLGKKDFIRLMNEKAKKMGMQKTYFINASGLTEKNKECNKSTAKELYF